MRHYDAHLNEEDLLLAIDGELSGSHAEQVEGAFGGVLGLPRTEAESEKDDWKSGCGSSR